VAQESDVVKLEVGGDHRHVRIARLVASGVASLAGFDVEAVEDLRIAVDEACVWLIDHGDGSPLRLTLRIVDGESIDVVGETDHAGNADATPSVLVEQILTASCGEHHFDTAGSVLRFRLVAHADRREATVVAPGASAG
jgi:serine/threonine-protein kinase RsbW